MTEKHQGDQDWFEGVYSNANQQTNHIPWADLRSNPFLLEWLETIEPDTHNKSAVVVGCGLGDDAEELAQRGYNVTAFDVSATAVDWCRQRFPDSKVDYVVADLFNLSKDWHFDFVLEMTNTISFIRFSTFANCIVISTEIPHLDERNNKASTTVYSSVLVNDITAFDNAFPISSIELYSSSLPLSVLLLSPS